MASEVGTVLMTADTVGGVFTYATTLAAALPDVRFHLATMGEALRPEQRTALSSNVTVHESTYALEWMDEPWDDVERAAAWLRGIARDVHPDVVHVNGYAHAGDVYGAPVVVVAHSCVLSWWDAALGEPAPPRYARYRAAVRDALLTADAVIAPSRAMLDDLVRLYGTPAEAHVIPNGARAPAERTVAKEPLVLAAGRVWDRAKNLEALVRIAPRLAWPVAIAGWASESARGAANVDAIGWCGAEALAGLMDRAAIFALPARYEPFGLTALEAALHGCALVLGDIASLREVWADAATFVDPSDDAALARALNRLARDASLRESMADEARARASLYSAERFARTTFDVYRRVAEKRRLSSCA